MFKSSSIVQKVALAFFIAMAESASPQKRDTSFELVESIIGLLLLAICAGVYFRAKKKVKYVEF
jgi:hypothetical protein